MILYVYPLTHKMSDKTDQTSREDARISKAYTAQQRF